MKKILITGGPVHASLDSVKIITNRFKGGRMAELANDIAQDLTRKEKVKVTYLCSKNSVSPNKFVKTIYHNGFEDYREKVLQLAPKHDVVVLGAAVCNLIPMHPWKKKFPSHEYRVGARIPIDFTIAPRVIDEVKSVASNVHLFGFKLLQNVPRDELVRAAYDIVLESRATAVFANDASELDRKLMVTKEGKYIELTPEFSKKQMVEFILEASKDKYYSTNISFGDDWNLSEYHFARMEYKKLLKKYKSKLKKKYGKEKYLFGTVAVRLGNSKSFVTTVRGKRDLNEHTLVSKVNHKTRKVFAHPLKATLNAPLLHNLFKQHPQAKAIVHYHDVSNESIPHLPYAPSGTVRDSKKRLCGYPKDHTSFVIEGHGTFELLKEEDLS